jgi:hypothetical protein
VPGSARPWRLGGACPVQISAGIRRRRNRGSFLSLGMRLVSVPCFGQVASGVKVASVRSAALAQKVKKRRYDRRRSGATFVEKSQVGIVAPTIPAVVVFRATALLLGGPARRFASRYGVLGC